MRSNEKSVFPNYTTIITKAILVMGFVVINDNSEVFVSEKLYLMRSGEIKSISI